MGTIYDWSTTAAENTSVEGVNIAEGCPAANMNDAIRGMMAAVRATFNADMRFTANLSVGTANPGVYRLKVVAGIAGNSMAGIQNTDVTGYSGFHFLKNDGNVVAHVGYANASALKHAGKAYVGSTAAVPLTLTTSDEERVVIDASGVVHVGQETVPGSGRVRVAQTGGYGLSTYSTGNYNAIQYVRDISGTAVEMGNVSVTDFDVAHNARTNMLFRTNGGEAFRIDQNQRVLMGATSVPGSGRLRISETGVGGFCLNTNGSATYTALQVLNVGAQVGSITADSSQTYYNTSSDERLKENIAAAGDFGDLIDAVQVRQFDWRATGDKQRAGFIAQELYALIPEAVHAPDDPDEMMAIDPSKLVAFLWQEVKFLRSRVNALEAR